MVESKKRALDLAVGLVLAVLSLPVILVLALGSVASLRAWPFFVQSRVGRDGKLFRIVKIRTLPPQAPRSAPKYALQGLPIPRYCSFLRRTHLDELPQLLLVPLGRMSLVGPRPEMPELVGTFDPSFLAARSAVRPGCTGLWQISVDSPKLLHEVPEYDLFYLEHAGLRLDLWILWRTVRGLLPRHPEVKCESVPLWVYGRGLLPTPPVTQRRERPHVPSSERRTSGP